MGCGLHTAREVLVTSFIVGMIFCFVPYVLSEDTSIKVTKSASRSEFNWDDTIVITLSIKNEGGSAVNNVTIIDYVPEVFDGEPETLVDSAGKINITRNTLLPDEELSYSYTLKGKKDLSSELNVTLRALQVSFKDETGVFHLRTSDDIVVTVKSGEADPTVEMLIQSSLLLCASFLFGLFGSFINSLGGLGLKQVLPDTAKIKGVYSSQNKESISFSAPKSVKVNKQFNVELSIDPDSLKEIGEGSYKIEMQLSRKNQVWKKEIPWSKEDKKFSIPLLPQVTGEHSLKCSIIDAKDNKVVSDYSTNPVTIDVSKSLTYDLLIGGVAGIIILVSLEALSAVFADKGLDLNVKTMITITVSCIAAGLVPQKIIENYTKTLTKEKEEAEKERDQVQERQEETDSKIGEYRRVDEVSERL